MKRVGLVSDSHGHLDDLKRCVEEMGDVDLIVHTGDYVTDADEIRTWTNIPVMAVKGNMDAYVEDRPDFIKTVIDGLPVYITHGHRENVKFDVDRLVYKAQSNRKDMREIDGVLVVNPGSCALPGDGSKSYAILTFDDHNVECRFYELED